MGLMTELDQGGWLLPGARHFISTLFLSKCLEFDGIWDQYSSAYDYALNSSNMMYMWSLQDLDFSTVMCL